VGLFVGDPIQTRGMTVDDCEDLMNTVRTALNHAEVQTNVREQVGIEGFQDRSAIDGFSLNLSALRVY